MRRVTTGALRPRTSSGAAAAVRVRLGARMVAGATGAAAGATGAGAGGVTACTLGAARLVLSAGAIRPRSPAPRRCTMRYTDDSPIENCLLMSGTGVVVSAYRRVTSRSCSSVSLWRGGKVRRVSSAPSRVTTWRLGAMHQVLLLLTGVVSIEFPGRHGLLDGADLQHCLFSGAAEIAGTAARLRFFSRYPFGTLGRALALEARQGHQGGMPAAELQPRRDHRGNHVSTGWPPVPTFLKGRVARPSTVIVLEQPVDRADGAATPPASPHLSSTQASTTRPPGGPSGRPGWLPSAHRFRDR